MLRIFVIAATYLLFLASQAFAVEVEELDIGACWAKSETSGDRTVWQVASFNDDRNFYYPMNTQLDDAITVELKKIFAKYSATRFRVDLHCGGGGHRLFISFYDGKNPVCAWAKRSANSNVEFDVEQIAPNPAADPNQACIGIVPGNLLLGLKNPQDKRSVEFYLKARYGRMIDSIDYLQTSGLIIAKLKAVYHFNEKTVHDLWLKDRFLKARLNYVEYDQQAIISGSYLQLRSGTYPGF
jgi:hypothetical protein